MTDDGRPNHESVFASSTPAKQRLHVESFEALPVADRRKHLEQDHKVKAPANPEHHVEAHKRAMVQ